MPTTLPRHKPRETVRSPRTSTAMVLAGMVLAAGASALARPPRPNNPRRPTRSR